MFATGLRCIRPGCNGAVDLDSPHYVCPGCGANLQVDYDYEAIRARLTRASLEQNVDRTIWRYAPLYPVRGRIEQIPIGWTPLVKAPRMAQQLGLEGVEVLVKDDGRNPSASFKDRASAIALVRAQEQGHQLVTGASTGNAASSTAVLAAAMGIKARIFIPESAPKAKVAQLLAFGAEVLAVQGTYDQAFDLCLAATERFGWYNRNTGYNAFTREGKKSVSFEICEQLGWQVPDLIAVPVGDGNIISGVWKGLTDLHRIGLIDRLPRLLAVQAEHSDAIVSALEREDGSIQEVSGCTVADSISVGLPRDGDAAVQAVRESKGIGIRVTDEQILAAIPQVARQAAVFGEPAGVTAYAGLQAAVAQGLVDASCRRIVVLVTGSGLKDVASVMKVAGEPRSIAPDPAALEQVFKDEA